MSGAPSPFPYPSLTAAGRPPTRGESGRPGAPCVVGIPFRSGSGACPVAIQTVVSRAVRVIGWWRRGVWLSPGGATRPAERPPGIRLGQVRDEVTDLGETHDPTPRCLRRVIRPVGFGVAGCGSGKPPGVTEPPTHRPYRRDVTHALIRVASVLLAQHDAHPMRQIVGCDTPTRRTGACAQRTHRFGTSPPPPNPTQ